MGGPNNYYGWPQQVWVAITNMGGRNKYWVAVTNRWVAAKDQWVAITTPIYMYMYTQSFSDASRSNHARDGSRPIVFQAKVAMNLTCLVESIEELHWLYPQTLTFVLIIP